MTKALRPSRPRNRPRTRATAAGRPMRTESAAVATPRWVDSQSACMNSRRAKKLANHLREKPCGGKVK